MNPDNACTLRITAAAGTELAGASSGGIVTPKRVLTVGHSSLLTVVYNPRAVIPHTASLRQPFGHCAIFPTAASRRSLGRISVPMWLIILSDQLPVEALVSRYLTNKLIGREPLFRRDPKAAFTADHKISRITRYYPVVRPAIPHRRTGCSRVTHPSATRSPKCKHLGSLVRLACVKHAASVRPEPGSNSPIEFIILKLFRTTDLTCRQNH